MPDPKKPPPEPPAQPAFGDDDDDATEYSQPHNLPQRPDEIPLEDDEKTVMEPPPGSKPKR
jgi:hypothetical protein